MGNKEVPLPLGFEAFRYHADAEVVTYGYLVRRYSVICYERGGGGSFDVPHVKIYHSVTQPASTIDVNSTAWLIAHGQRKRNARLARWLW